MTMPNPTALPQGLEVYKRTSLFTEASVPAGLLKDHNTKEGTWGVIRCVGGQLCYRVTDARREAFETVLVPGAEPGLVEPTVLHHVEPLGTVCFYVEFYRAAPDAIPLCRHEELARRENDLRDKQDSSTAPDLAGR